MHTEAERQSIRQEIIDNCEIVGDCWLWKGYVNDDGYGMKKVGDAQPHPVHRIMLCIATGQSLSTRYDAGHDTDLCPYKSCCNPDHLMWEHHYVNCKRREDDKRKTRAVFRYWESHAWIGGMFVLGRTDPAIEASILSIGRTKGKVPRKNRGADHYPKSSNNTLLVPLPSEVTKTLVIQ